MTTHNLHLIPVENKLVLFHLQTSLN